MIFAALVFAATTYQSMLTKYDVPIFESGKAKYEFYAEGDVGDGRKVVVYGFTPVRRGDSRDIDHYIFVTMIKGNEILSARRDLTETVFNTGERGRFADFRATVKKFTLKRGEYVDITLWSSISGGVSAASDVILRIARDNTLVIASRLENTEELSRNGSKEIRQTSSQLSVSEDGALQWTKKERLAFRDKSDKPYRVNCQTTRTTYRPLAQGIAPSDTAPKGKLKPLARLDLKEIVPCCSSCELKQ